MDTYNDSPEVGGVPAGNRTPPQNQNLDTQLLPDPALLGNIRQVIPSSERQLLEKRAGVSLWALTEGRRTTYQVVSGQSAWAFNLLFPAISKFDRLARKGAAQP